MFCDDVSCRCLIQPRLSKTSLRVQFSRTWAGSQGRIRALEEQWGAPANVFAGGIVDFIAKEKAIGERGRPTAKWRAHFCQVTATVEGAPTDVRKP